jgi:CheY-like chemotaxis protein
MERTADRKPVVLVVEDEQSIEMVEDEQLVRMPAIEMVEEAGFEAIEAIDANEAIRILESRSDIRAVFTDIQMPGSMDGLKLARALRDRWPPVALIVTSGRTDISANHLPSGGGNFLQNRMSHLRYRQLFGNGSLRPGLLPKALGHPDHSTAR